MNHQLSLSIILSSFLAACGGGGSDTPPATPIVVSPTPTAPVITTYTGKFVDAAVIGINYKTAEEAGITNADGEFIYRLDEKVTFSIGDIVFPEVLADAIITPLNIFNTTDVNNLAVVNALRLLQTLDEDGDPENGITILSEAHQLASGVTVDFTSSEFESQVTNFIAGGNQLNKQLITADDAIYHFQLTLNEMNGEPMNDCDSTHEKVGQTGFFNTYFHNVAGKAEIINNCTIEITQFSYDGGGPDVYFYAANDGAYGSEDAFSMGRRLNGTIHEDGVFTLKLPNNKTLDDLNGISVWCVDFAANFGDVTFSP
jgi:hypothetical protein